MATFVPAANGYIIDVPALLFTPNGKKRIVFDKLTSASVNNGANNIPINGGWSNFPLAIIDTDKTLEFTFESSEFSQKLFAMTNGSTIVKESAVVPKFANFEVETGLKIKLPDTAVAGSVSIDGFEEVETTLEAGKFTVTAVPLEGEVPAHTLITFNTGDVTVGDVMQVSYEVTVSDAETVTTYTNAASVSGSMVLVYPIYAGADKGSGVIGTLFYEVFKVRASTLPGFNNSYKSASTFGATFTGLDAGKPDKSMTKLTFKEGLII